MGSIKVVGVHDKCALRIYMRRWIRQVIVVSPIWQVGHPTSGGCAVSKGCNGNRRETFRLCTFSGQSSSESIISIAIGSWILLYTWLQKVHLFAFKGWICTFQHLSVHDMHLKSLILVLQIEDLEKELVHLQQQALSRKRSNQIYLFFSIVLEMCWTKLCQLGATRIHSGCFCARWSLRMLWELESSSFFQFEVNLAFVHHPRLIKSKRGT